MLCEPKVPWGVPSRLSVAGIGVEPPIDHLVSSPLMMALQRLRNLLGSLLMLNIAHFNSGPLSPGSKHSFIGTINKLLNICNAVVWGVSAVSHSIQARARSTLVTSRKVGCNEFILPVSRNILGSGIESRISSSNTVSGGCSLDVCRGFGISFGLGSILDGSSWESNFGDAEGNS